MLLEDKKFIGVNEAVRLVEENEKEGGKFYKQTSGLLEDDPNNHIKINQIIKEQGKRYNTEKRRRNQLEGVSKTSQIIKKLTRE